MTTTASLSLEAAFALADELEILQRLPRAGFVMSGVTAPQTVAAHSFGVALWCLVLMERVAAPATLDRAKVLTMAVLHELAEARLTDIPQPARRYLGEQLVSDAERRVVDDLLAAGPAPWRAAWHEFEDGATLEARIVKAADKLELMHRILMYEQQHNGALARFWHGDKNFRWEGLAAARELFEEMQRRHDQQPAPPQ
jgi:putative hydrolase of HD superfamily